MKKLVLSLMAAVALMFVPQTLAAVNFVQYLATYGNSLTIDTDTLGGVTYSTVRYGDLYNGGEPGMPSLPIDYIRFSVPYNATNFTVTASPSRWSFSNLSYLLYPCQMPWIPNDSIARPITLPDTAAYYSGVSYPSQMAWVVDEGFLAGENHIVTVAVMPFRYTHTTTSDEVRKCRNLTVRLNYELSDSLAMYPIVRNDSALREEGHQLAQSMVVNSNQVKSFSFSYNLPGPTVPFDPISPNAGLGGDGMNFYGDPGELIYDPDIPANPDSPYLDVMGESKYSYLIVTTPEFYNSVRRIAALKRQKGYSVKIVMMDQVMNDSNAYIGDKIRHADGSYYIAYNDSAGVLRQFLKRAYSIHGTEYVLLVGHGIPFRYNKIIVDSIPSDLYFSDLSADWHQGQIDKKSELYVGRILAEKDQQVANYTDKLFRYELNPGRGSTDYLRRLLYTEAIDYELFKEWKYLNNSYKKTFPENESTRMLERINSKYPSGTDIIDELNATKYGYLSMLNHAGPSGFITYGRRDFYPKDTTDSNVYYYLWSIDSVHITYNNNNYMLDAHTKNGFNNMDNKWYPNICYSSGCTTMPFDHVAGYNNVEINIGESFTTGKDYGGPAFLGNTRNGCLCNQSTRLESMFADELSKGNNKVGVAEALSKSFFNVDSIAIAHNLLGDPEFNIWLDTPNLYSNISIIRYNDSITISGLDTDLTLISYYNNDRTGGKKSVNTSSITLNNVSPNCAIMLSGDNKIPYIAPMELQNITISKSQYLITSDFIAGRKVNNRRLFGDVRINNGVEYELEASGDVLLEGGFIVEKGAVFAVYPSSF